MSATGLNRSLAREWVDSDRRVALATLVETVGSAPLDAGAMMLVGDGGEIEGSVTGGCVEGALAQEAAKVLAGAGPEVHTYGISDDEASGVGLMCGGTVHIFLEELQGDQRDLMSEVLAAEADGRPAAVATLLDGPGRGLRLALIDGEVKGGLDIGLLDRNVENALRGMLEHGESGLRHFGEDGATMGDELRVHIQSFAEPPRMIIFGAIDFSVATAALAGELGFKVEIVDARAPFLSSPRFSRVAETAVEWPDRYMDGVELGPRDVVLVFTHDRKFDQPALIAALNSGAGYVGALGSRRTQEQRAERLLEAGLPQSEIDRIAAPCGLDIGARTPAETAISILAEVIANRNAREGERLSETEGSIHAR